MRVEVLAMDTADNTMAGQEGGFSDIPEAPDEILPSRRFGTFGGVFTPCVLTIFGVIMFMRTGFVVGVAGLWIAIVILLISKLITSLTALSLSAISTNVDMKVGGVYYMISRVLGLNFGGAIGVTLYLAQAVGVAFYVVGFTEATQTLLQPFLSAHTVGGKNLFELWQVIHLSQIVSTLLLVALFILTFKGADIVVKTQYFVLAILLMSIVSFLVGGVVGFNHSTFDANKVSGFNREVSFWTVFAIFFPAATGITAGANMSGDLKNPARAIPLGTILAILFTAAIYTMQIVLMAGCIGRSSLINDPFGALKSMSIFSPLVVLGVFTATVSSALGSFLGAPRILQSMGQDRLLGIFSFFGKGSGPSDEPRRATVVTFVIALCVVWMGDLNRIAQIISMFFLIAYGTINLSAFVESTGANPSFRPKFKWMNRFTALGGAGGCIVAMVKVNETAALVAIGITSLIWFYLTRKNIQTDWGDAKRGYIFAKIRNNLFQLRQTKAHPKNWRPILTAIATEPSHMEGLVSCASLLEGGRGLLSVVDMCPHIRAEEIELMIELRRKRIEALERIMNSKNITGFCEAVVGGKALELIPLFLQSYSLGPLRPNTVMITLPEEEYGKIEEVAKQLRVFYSFNLNIAVVKMDREFTRLASGEVRRLKRRAKMVDVWWRGEKNGSLMAIFAYLVGLNSGWRRSSLRIIRVVNSEDEKVEAYLKLTAMVKRARLPAKVEIIVSDRQPREVIPQVSAHSDIIFLGMDEGAVVDFGSYVQKMGSTLEKLKTVILVYSNGEANIFV